MPRSWASQALERFVRAYVDPTLTRHGFSRPKRTSRIWNRGQNDTIQAIDVQTSMGAIPDHSEFYLNIGILAPAVWQIVSDRPLPDPMHPSQGHVYDRIEPQAASTSPAKDCWQISRSTDIDALGAELVRVLDQQTMPWLDRRSTIDGLREHFVDWDARQAPHDVGSDAAYLAVEGLLGNVDRVRQLADEALRRHERRFKRLERERLAHYEDLVRRYQEGDVHAERQLLLRGTMVGPPPPIPRHDPRPGLRQILERLGLDPGVVDEGGDSSR